MARTSAGPTRATSCPRWGRRIRAPPSTITVSTLAGVADKITEKEPWEQALTIAARVMNAQDWIPEIGNATHYHADYVRPRWVRDMTEKDRIGKHIFYRVKWWA